MAAADPDVEAFFRALARAFEAAEPQAIAALWAYPAHVAAALTDRVALTAVSSAEEFQAPLREVLELYRRVGCRRVRLLGLDAEALAGPLRRCTARWGLVGLADLPLYDFTTSYLLARVEGKWRAVSAVSHDEHLRYRAFIGR